MELDSPRFGLILRLDLLLRLLVVALRRQLTASLSLLRVVVVVVVQQSGLVVVESLWPQVVVVEARGEGDRARSQVASFGLL